ncbi:N-acetylmuramoyl-L-alanine amidase [Halobacillus sp. MO56]
MKKIIIDPGHGGNDPGATYKSYEEKQFNLSIALKVRDYLLKNYEVDIGMTRTRDITVSLEERTRLANSKDADFFLSIHNNAAGGTGFESYIFSGTVPPATKAHQNIIHDMILDSVESKYGINDRGKKRANFHVLRETKMSALLLEVLFLDNPDDLEHLTDPEFIQDVSIAIAEGVKEAFDLPAKTVPGVLYKVIAGSFKNRTNAENRVQYLATHNIDSFIVPTTISGEQYYRVQAGAYSQRENAEQQVQKLKSIGITDAFILTEGEVPSPPPSTPEERFTIQGDIHLNPCQLEEFVKTINPDAPDLGAYYMEYGEIYGIRADVAYAQAIHETDYFRFTGVVDDKQNNFAGIGATGPDNPGASFATPAEGVHAHIQHLYAYASSEPIPNGYTKVDPRFDLVNRGSATTWTQLNGKWAVPGNNYGQSIISIFRRNINHALEQIDAQQVELQELLNDL